MNSTINAFLAIALFKKKPQDLPSSKLLFNTALCFYAGIGLLHTSIYETFDTAIQVTIIDLLFLLSVIYLCLSFFRLNNRWQQTITAIAGSSSILGIVAIPVSLLLMQAQQNSLLASLAGYLMFFLFVWTIALYGYIFRHAFSILPFFAIFMAIFYNLLVYVVVSSLIPGLNS